MTVRALFGFASLVLLTACGPDAQAPIPIGFTGTCKLAIQNDTRAYSYTFLTPDELKTHITLHIVKDTLVSIHVEIPDNRRSSSFEKLPDNPLLVGDAKPDVALDRSGDVEVPMQLHLMDAHGEAQEPWDLPVRIRFRGNNAEAIAGRMRAQGACVVPPPQE